MMMMMMMMTSWKLLAVFFMALMIMLSTANDTLAVDLAPQQHEHQKKQIRPSLHQNILSCNDFGANEVRLKKTVRFLKSIACDTPQVSDSSSSHSPVYRASPLHRSLYRGGRKEVFQDLLLLLFRSRSWLATAHATVGNQEKLNKKSKKIRPLS